MCQWVLHYKKKKKIKLKGAFCKNTLIIRENASRCIYICKFINPMYTTKWNNLWYKYLLQHSKNQ